MVIEYTDSTEEISAGMLNGFFVGWPNPPSNETFLKILKNSSHIEIAVDKNTGNVVGFINAISDGVLSAYIPLLEVLPKYQNNGIATKIIERLFNRLTDFYMIDLTCDVDMNPFYEKFGLKKMNGMFIRNFDFQSGRKE